MEVPMPWPAFPYAAPTMCRSRSSRFPMPFAHMLAETDSATGEATMLAIHQGQAAAPSIAEHLAKRCRQHAVPAAGDGVARVLRLAEAKAWTDAALALIELEQPRWRLRRLVQEGGEWFCALSRHPSLPLELDDCAEAHNELMVLAILDALSEAREKDAAAVVLKQGAVHPAQLPSVTAVCDDFG